MSKTFEFLKACKVFYMLTVAGDAPCGRPFGAVMEYDGSIYISTSKSKDVYKQLLCNSKIQIVALKAESREWIRINGKAIEYEKISMKAKMLDECPVLKKHFSSAECENFALFRIADMESYLYSDDGMEKID